MKFNRFIPAYHNHFGKQCRVADYGYTRLIELFEALTSVVQVRKILKFLWNCDYKLFSIHLLR